MKNLCTKRARASVSTDAARLASELQGDDVPAGDGIRAEMWLSLMGAIATGTPPRKAAYKAGVSQRLLTAYIRADCFLAQHYAKCVIACRRKRWPMLTLLDVFSEIACTNTSAKAALMRRGYTASETQAFYGLVWRTPDLAEQYLRAKAAQQSLLRDELMSESWARVDEITGNAAARQHARAFNKAELAIRKLLPQRQRRAEAKAFRAARAGDPLAEARLRATERGS
jgi:hypothetical protein